MNYLINVISILLLFQCIHSVLSGVATTASATAAAAQVDPIVFVPGLTGSRLEFRYHPEARPPWYCHRNKGEWMLGWVAELTMTFQTDCWAYMMGFKWNETARKAEPNAGVETRVPGFGDTVEVETLYDGILPKWFPWKIPDIPLVMPVNYMRHFVERSVAELGLVRNRSIRAAPYDFRLAPHMLDDYYDRLRDLIEATQVANGGAPVTLLAQSYGVNVAHYFLVERTSQEWRDAHIGRFVSVCGPFGGSLSALAAYGGDKSGAFFGKIDTLMRVYSTFPAVAYLIPSDRLYEPEAVLLQTPTRNFTAARDYRDLFDFVSRPDGYQMHMTVRNDSEPLKPPQVHTLCAYSVGENTTSGWRMIGADKFEEHHSDGDGTVLLKNLLPCRDWSNDPAMKRPTEWKEFSGLHHGSEVTNDKFIDWLFDYLRKAKRP